jgi:UMF1 family MFS transporter
MSEPVRRREIFGWCCYDFANSAFITVVITVVYGPYFTGVVAAGWAGANTLWSVILAASQVVVMVFGPALGVLADVTASKKKFLLSMMWVCSAATAALWLTGPGTVALAAGLVIVAYAAFSFGENFCASFLSELSTPANCGRISGYGWSFGYLGGLGALGLAMLVLSVSPDGVRWVFVVTALFMVAATLPVLLLLRERKQPEPHVARWWQLGWESVLRAARDLPAMCTRTPDPRSWRVVPGVSGGQAFRSRRLRTQSVSIRGDAAHVYSPLIVLAAPRGWARR